MAALTAILAWSCGSESPPETRPPNLTPLETTTTAPAGPPIEVGRTGLRLERPDAAGGDVLAPEQAVTGPTLRVDGVPAGTVALAIVVVDADRGRTHWVLSGLDPATTLVDPGAPPPDAVEYQNESGEFGWLPVSDTPTRLRISVQALDTTITPTPENPTAAVTAFDAVAIDEASILVRVTDDP